MPEQHWFANLGEARAFASAIFAAPTLQHVCANGPIVLCPPLYLTRDHCVAVDDAEAFDEVLAAAVHSSYVAGAYGDRAEWERAPATAQWQ